MTVKQAAERLEVSASTIYGLVAMGKLKCCRVGLRRGVIRITEEQLSAFMTGSVPVAIKPPAPPRRPRVKNLRLP
jgi:excisionase family DNA binding protein